MSRAEQRRAQKEKLGKTKTYILTQKQIDAIRAEAIKEAHDAAAEKAFILMLAIPLEVLITEDYWMKSAKRRLPKFIDEVLRVYKGYENGMISIDEMKDDLLEFAGIKIGTKK